MAQKEQVNQDALAAEWGLAPKAGQAAAGTDKTADTAADAATDVGAGAGAGASASAGGVAGDQTAVQWAAMLDDSSNHAQAGKGGAERILNQEEIDGLLGFSLSDVALNNNSGIRAIIDSAMVSYERLPMLEIVFDRLVRLMTTSLRNFTSDNVEVSLDRITSVRFGDYLNSIPLPAILAVFKAEEWDNFGLVTINSSLIYSIVDVLLGGRRGQTAIRVEGRPYTSIESNLVKRMIEVVLADAEIAFKPLSPVKFNIDRMETNPRFAAISRPANAAILVRLRVDMEDRGGDFELLLPYATIEPIRGVLLQMFMGEKFGRDPIWEGHLATEIGQAEIAVDAVLYEAQLPLKQMMKLEVGDTLMLEMKSDAAVSVRCGSVILSEGHMGRVGDHVAVRVTKPLRRPRTTFAMFENADQSVNRMELP
jgi:flagellar motor switch protein FliM